jgi:hypothetical protein
MSRKFIFGGSFGSIPSLDPDAVAFLTAAAITDPTITSAIDTLVVDLKGYGIWTKMKALYPFVGGTASTHKFNLVNPLDTNAAFRLVFFGGWTHGSTGALPNGTNGYADTFFIPSTNFTSLNNKSFGNYIGTNTNIGIDMGSLNSSFTGDQIVSRITNISGHNSSNINTVTVASSDSRGFWLSTRINSTQAKLYKNSSLIITEGASISQHNLSIVIGARRNNLNPFVFTDKRFQFAFLGDGLSDTEAANFYTSVQAFQTTLGRQV